jgi:hypothetical protein
MEILRYLFQKKQGSLILSMILSLIVAFTAYNQNVHSFEENEIWCALPPPEYSEQETGMMKQLEFESVQLWDKTLGMALGTMLIPKGWIFEQDIALNNQTGLYERYQADLLGPDGQLIRAVNSKFYSPQVGIGFEETWRNIVENAIRFELDDVMIGHLQQSRTFAKDALFREMASMMRNQGIKMEALEVPFSGRFENRRYRGVAYVAHANNPWLDDTGVVTVKLVTSPVELFDETVNLDIKVSGTYTRNSLYEQRVAMIQMHAMNRNQSDGHYYYHQYSCDCEPYYSDGIYWNEESISVYPHFEQMNRQWYENFFGSWDTQSSYSTYSEYSTNDYFLDTVTGYSTFNDPYSGYQVRVEGNYRYNYTDGYGNFYGTDDPWFDPNKEFNGYWYPVDSLSPE